MQTPEGETTFGLTEYWIVRPSTRDVLVLTQRDIALGIAFYTTTLTQTDELAS